MCVCGMHVCFGSSSTNTANSDCVLLICPTLNSMLCMLVLVEVCTLTMLPCSHIHMQIPILVRGVVMKVLPPVEEEVPQAMFHQVARKNRNLWTPSLQWARKTEDCRVREIVLLLLPGSPSFQVPPPSRFPLQLLLHTCNPWPTMLIRRSLGTRLCYAITWHIECPHLAQGVIFVQ